MGGFCRRLDAKHALPSYAAVRNAVEDAHQAVDFAGRGDFNVDSKRIAMWGESAGAISAASMHFVNGTSHTSEAPRPTPLGHATGHFSIIWLLSMILCGPTRHSPPLPPPELAAAVGISGCVWPFILNGQRHQSGGQDQPLPAPWFDVHGDQDDRVFPFLPRVTHDYLRSVQQRSSTVHTMPPPTKSSRLDKPRLRAVRCSV